MKVFFLLVFIFISIIVVSQKVTSVIPYTLVGDKMVVEMNVNGKPGRFIFDTGGHTALNRGFCEELGLKASDSIQITDANSRQMYCPVVRIEKFSTADGKFHFRNPAAMLVPEPSPFECFGVQGLIGSDLMQKSIVVIDGKAKTITLTTPDIPVAASLRRMQQFARSGYMPIVTFQAGTKEVIALFDSGCGGMMSLKNSDYSSLEAEGVVVTEAEGVGEGGLSIAGMAEKSTKHRVVIPQMSFGAANFLNFRTEVDTPPYTLLGVKMLDYGKVTIDYPRQRFYFEPYRIDNEVKMKKANLGLRVKEGKLIIATVWEDMKDLVEVGDTVTHINGKPVREFDFCQSILEGIPELKAGKKSVLTVRTADGDKIVTYIKK